MEIDAETDPFCFTWEDSKFTNENYEKTVKITSFDCANIRTVVIPEELE
jgi:hypothetical protein